MYLLDTNVVSELRRAKPHGAVLTWFNGLDDKDIHLSAVTIGEIQSGIERARETDPGKAAELDQWLDQVEVSFNVLPLGSDDFRIWARLMHRQSDTLYEDALIAATAKAHGLTVATRNVSDFLAFDVPIVNPFES